jgi:hypothetical protein
VNHTSSTAPPPIGHTSSPHTTDIIQALEPLTIYRINNQSRLSSLDQIPFTWSIPTRALSQSHKTPQDKKGIKIEKAISPLNLFEPASTRYSHHNGQSPSRYKRSVGGAQQRIQQETDQTYRPSFLTTS